MNINQEVIDEVLRAKTKFPEWPTDPFHALGILGEELGELNKDIVQHMYEPNKGVTRAMIRAEAIQTAAMALRFVQSLDHYDYSPGPQHLQAVETDDARPLDEWHEEYGEVMWWFGGMSEAPYVGSPLCDDWPGYHTHWTPLPKLPTNMGYHDNF